MPPGNGITGIVYVTRPRHTQSPSVLAGNRCDVGVGVLRSRGGARGRGCSCCSQTQSFPIPYYSVCLNLKASHFLMGTYSHSHSHCLPFMISAVHEAVHFSPGYVFAVSQCRDYNYQHYKWEMFSAKIPCLQIKKRSPTTL